MTDDPIRSASPKKCPACGGSGVDGPLQCCRSLGSKVGKCHGVAVVLVKQEMQTIHMSVPTVSLVPVCEHHRQARIALWGPNERGYEEKRINV